MADTSSTQGGTESGAEDRDLSTDNISVPALDRLAEKADGDAGKLLGLINKQNQG